MEVDSDARGGAVPAGAARRARGRPVLVHRAAARPELRRDPAGRNDRRLRSQVRPQWSRQRARASFPFASLLCTVASTRDECTLLRARRWLQFTNVRIPRENMLMKWAQVHPDVRISLCLSHGSPPPPPSAHIPAARAAEQAIAGHIHTAGESGSRIHDAGR